MSCCFMYSIITLFCSLCWWILTNTSSKTRGHIVMLPRLWGGKKRGMPHCPKNNQNLRIKTEPVNTTVYVWYVLDILYVRKKQTYLWESAGPRSTVWKSRVFPQLITEPYADNVLDYGISWYFIVITLDDFVICHKLQ